MIAFGLAVAAVAVLAGLTGVMQGPELRSVDARYGLRSEPPVRDVAIVQLDSRSLGVLNQPTYPLPRRLHGRVIDRLRSARADVIAFDIAFLGLTRSTDDQRLADAAARAGNVVFDTDRVDSAGRTNLLGGDENLRAFKIRPADAGAPADPGATIRRFIGSVDGLKTFPVVAAEVAGNRRITIVGRPYIDFAGPAGTIPTYSFGDVLEGRVPASRFAGRAVVVGPGLELETHPTAVGDMSGAEIQANALHTVLQGSELRPLGKNMQGALLAVLGFVVTLIAGRARPLLTIAVVGLVVAGILVAADRLFKAGTIIPIATPIATVLLGGAVGGASGAAAERLRRLRRRFGQYVPDAEASRRLTRDAEGPRPGVAVDVTILFADLRGFTSYSEQRDPAEVVRTLNRYLGDMSSTISDHGGVVIDFMGDGIMAAFGLGNAEGGNHADRALDAAVEMTTSTLEAVNAWMREQDDGAPLRLGVGLNSGQVIAGAIGSAERMTYTAIGDTTNTASRIESLTKELGRSLLLSEATKERLSAEGVHCLEPVAEVPIRGRTGLTQLWSVAAAP